jgi:hypothetical protein
MTRSSSITLWVTRDPEGDGRLLEVRLGDRVLAWRRVDERDDEELLVGAGRAYREDGDEVFLVGLRDYPSPSVQYQPSNLGAAIAVLFPDLEVAS